METKYNPYDLVSVVQKKIVPPNCDQTLQIEPTFAHDGYAMALWMIDDKFINGHGVVMGGFLAAATDTIMAYAIASLLDANQTFASIDLHTTFHRPLLRGTAKLEAKVERKGNKTAYLTAEVFQNEKKCCSSVSSIMIMEN
ncbi:PaaI family thioesterase [Niallia sp. XMNu-256]|uniref:PaaI family thioesterase n=1 Tax=Niallia sp. XMNu-256 TaxID=3082444 RepID=UPI0030CDFC7F